MAVENKEVLGQVIRTEVRGGDLVSLAGTFEVAAADSDGSIYRLFKVNKNMVPIKIEINCDAMTGSTSWDLGLYDTLELGGAVVDANCFMSAVDLSAGKAMGSEQNGLAALPIATIGKQVYEVAALTSDTGPAEYDVALTANTVGSAAGTVSIRAIFAKAS